MYSTNTVCSLFIFIGTDIAKTLRMLVLTFAALRTYSAGGPRYFGSVFGAEAHSFLLLLASGDVPGINRLNVHRQHAILEIAATLLLAEQANRFGSEHENLSIVFDAYPQATAIIPVVCALFFDELKRGHCVISLQTSVPSSTAPSSNRPGWHRHTFGVVLVVSL